MSDPAGAATRHTDTTPSTEALVERVRGHLQDELRGPLRAAVERYHDALAGIIETTDSRALAAAGESPPGSGSGPAAGPSPGQRLAYAGRFVDAFADDLMAPAADDRGALFTRLAALPEADLQVPETLEAPPARPGAVAPPAVRPRPEQRLLGRVRKPAPRTVPAGLLVQRYLAELAARLEPAYNRAASLESVALAELRRRLHLHADPGGRPRHDGDGELSAAAESVLDEVARAIDAVAGELAAALRAPAVRVTPDSPLEVGTRAARRRDRLVEDWESFQAALHANTRGEAILARALASIDLSTAGTVAALEAALDERAHDPLTRLAARLEALAAEAETELADGVDAAAVESLRERATGVFREELRQITRKLGLELEAATRGYLEELSAVPETIPEGLRISEQPIAGIPDRPRELELRDAPLADLLRTACQGTIPRWIEREVEETGQELEALSQELRRIRNAVDFHIRAPLRGDFDDAQARDLIVGALGRAATQLEELRATVLDPVERLIAELQRLTDAEAEAARTAVADREFLRIRTEIAEEQAARGISAARAWGQRLVETGLRLVRAGWSAGRRSYGLTQEWAERQLGTGAVERVKMLESVEASLLGEDQARLPLPGLYRQLMDMESEVPWEELLVPRPDELSVLERAFDRWRRGQLASVAVVGEKGSGKSTLLRMAADRFGDTAVHRVDLGATVADPAALVARLGEAVDVEVGDPGELATELRARAPSVVVVEDAHHLFLRALGGFHALESFLELISATRQEVFWVITMDAYAWDYLDRVLALGSHFTHIITTTNLSPEHMERAIMARHDVSGLSLRYELEEERSRSGGRWKRLFRKQKQGELTRRGEERKAFFRQLNQIAEGNVFLALFYWLRSVDRVEDHTLVLRDPRIIELDYLDRLPLPSLHTIAGIILHGGLSEQEHRRVFQLSPAESRLQLATLADAHLIFRTPDGEYKVNKVLYRPLTRLLKAKNIF